MQKMKKKQTRPLARAGRAASFPHAAAVAVSFGLVEIRKREKTRRPEEYSIKQAVVVEFSVRLLIFFLCVYVSVLLFSKLYTHATTNRLTHTTTKRS